MSEPQVGGPGGGGGQSNSGSAPSSATAATFKVNDQSLRDLSATWAGLVQHLRDFNMELTKVGGNTKGLDKLQTLVGGPSGGTGQHPASPSGRSPGMPPDPNASGGSNVRSATGGRNKLAGGSSPFRPGGAAAPAPSTASEPASGNGQQLAGGSSPFKVPTSAKVGLGVVGAAGAYYQTRMGDISSADLFFNQQGQATAGPGGYNGAGQGNSSYKNQARQALFNKTSGVTGYQSVQDALGGAQTALGAVGGTTAPGSRGMSVLRDAGNMASLRPDAGLQGSANVSANIYDPSVSMRSMSMGFGATVGQGGQVQSQSQLFQSIINKSSGGRGLNSQQITEGLAKGAPLQATLAGLGLGPDAVAQFRQYGVAQANLGGNQQQTDKATAAASRMMNNQKVSKADEALVQKAGLMDSVRANQNKVGAAGARGTISAGQMGESGLEQGFSMLAGATDKLTTAFQALNAGIPGASGGIGGLAGSLGSPVGGAVKGLGGVMGASFALQSLRGHGGGGSGGILGVGAGSRAGGVAGKALGALTAADATPVWVVNMGAGGMGGGRGGGSGGAGGGGFGGAGANAPSGAENQDPARATTRLGRAGQRIAGSSVGQFASRNAGNAAMGLGAGALTYGLTSPMRTNADGSTNQLGSDVSTGATAAMTAKYMGMGAGASLGVGAAAIALQQLNNHPTDPNNPNSHNSDTPNSKSRGSLMDMVTSASKPGESVLTGSGDYSATSNYGSLADVYNSTLGKIGLGHVKYTGEDEKNQKLLDQFVNLISQWNARGLNGIPDAKKYYDEKVAPFDKKKTRDDPSNSQAGINAINVGLRQFGNQADKNSLAGPMSNTGVTSGPILNNPTPKLAVGGVVPGDHPHDNVMISATPGEVVVPKSDVARHGGADAFMKKVGFKGRNSPTKHYAGGGPVAPGGSGGGLLWPFPSRGGTQEGRTDEGWDLTAQPGGNVVAVASGTISLGTRDPNGFGTDYPIQHLDKAFTIDGQTFSDIYYGHTHSSKQGHVGAGEVIAHTGGGGLPQGGDGFLGEVEIGFGNPQAGSISYKYGSMMKDALQGAGTSGAATGPGSPGAAPGGASGSAAPAAASSSASSAPSGPGGGGIGANEQTALAPYIGGPSLGGGGGGGAPSKQGAGAPTAAGTPTKGGGSPAAAGPATANPGGPVKDQVKAAVKPRGWDVGAEWDALDQLINHESSWNPKASAEPASDASGLFQFLSTTWASVGATKTDDPFQQAIAGAKYIANRYKDPIGAWKFEMSHTPNWYEKGTMETSNELAHLHAGEMVVPKGPASRIRTAMKERDNSTKSGLTSASGSTQTRGVTVKIDIASVTLGGRATSTDVDNLVKAVTSRMENDKVLNAMGGRK